LRAGVGPVASVAFEPSGTRLATAGVDGSVHFWDVDSGKDLLTMSGRPASVLLAFSPAGPQLATARWEFRTAASSVTVTDNNGKQIATFRGALDRLTALAWSPDATRLAVAGWDLNKSAEVKLHDARTGQELFSLRGQTQQVSALGFSQNGNRLAAAGVDGGVMTWDVRRSPEARLIEGGTCVRFSHRGDRVAAVSHGTIARVHDTATGREALTVRGRAS